MRVGDSIRFTKMMEGIFHPDPPWTTASLAAEAKRVHKTTVGLLVRGGSCWIGFHYSTKQKRLCINFVPFVTIWVAFKGGFKP